VDDVLGATGTGKSQFYYYFEDKEDLGPGSGPRRDCLQVREVETDVESLREWLGRRKGTEEVVEGSDPFVLKLPSPSSIRSLIQFSSSSTPSG